MADVIVDTLVRGSILVLLALGLTLVQGTIRFANVAHVEFATWAAYVTVGLASVGLGVLPSAVLGVLVTAALAVLSYRLLFKRLLQSSPEITMIGSLALALTARAILQLVAGSRPHQLPTPLERGIDVGGALVSPSQIRMVIVSAVLVTLVLVLLRWTALGRSVRAVASNPELAAVSGINQARVIDAVWIIAAACAGTAGVLLAIDSAASLEMGVNLLLPVFAVAILGGLGSVGGAVLAALLLGLGEALLLRIDFGGLIHGAGQISVAYRPAVGFVVLVVALVVRPQGLLGRKVRHA